MTDKGCTAQQRSAKLRLLTIVLLTLVAFVSSALRFGHRENEPLPISDSDYYLDMAEVFAGLRSGFDESLSSQAPHHYNRPALPFLSGLVGHYLLHDNYRAAFSLINIAAAVLIAVLLYRITLGWNGASSVPWVPPVLFLTAFPQMNWGYHILTDTFGYATAFASSLFAIRVLDSLARQPERNVRRILQGLLLLFLLQSVAFLARETGWLVPVVASFYLIHLAARGRLKIRLGLVVILVILAGKLPHLVYSLAHGLHGIRFHTSLPTLLNPWYSVDFLVKSAFAFHLCWVAVIAFLVVKQRPALPPMVIGWSIAGLLYAGAGYLHNSGDMIGYPLRLSFSIFPFVYLLTAWVIQRIVSLRQSRLRVGIVYATMYLISTLGVLLDPEQGRIRVQDLWDALRNL